MRHLLAEPARPVPGMRLHLQATAKVQKSSERSKSEARAERVRRESQPHGNMIAFSAVRMANCQRGKAPTMHKL